MDLKQILEVQKELKRFNKRLEEMIVRAKADSYAFYGCKESGALKRGAMDLKNELTKITK